VLYPIRAPQGAQPLPRQAPTTAALEALAAAGWSVDRVVCATPEAYDGALRRWWQEGPFILIEHDVEPSAGALEALAACPEPLCAVAYPLWWSPEYASRWWRQAALLRESRAYPSWDDPTLARARALAERMANLLRADALHAVAGHPWAWTWAHRRWRPVERWITTGEPWADLAGFGCIKVGPAATALAPAWPAGAWDDRDSVISEWLYGQGYRWHVHWPAIPHHHGDPCHPDL